MFSQAPTTLNEYYLCPLSELQEKGVLAIEIEHPKYRGWEIAVFWDGERIGTLENFCPHQGAMLSWGTIEPGQVICPLHSAIFDIVTGECLDRYTYDATAFETFVRGDEVWARLPGRPIAQR